MRNCSIGWSYYCCSNSTSGMNSKISSCYYATNLKSASCLIGSMISRSWMTASCLTASCWNLSSGLNSMNVMKTMIVTSSTIVSCCSVNCYSDCY